MEWVNILKDWDKVGEGASGERKNRKGNNSLHVSQNLQGRNVLQYFIWKREGNDHVNK